MHKNIFTVGITFGFCKHAVAVDMIQNWKQFVKNKVYVLYTIMFLFIFFIYYYSAC